MSKKIWEPLSDGRHVNDLLAVSYQGRDIGIKIDDEPREGDNWINNYQWLGDIPGGGLPSDFRLCRQVEAAPCVEMTPGRVDAITTLLGLAVAYGGNDHARVREIAIEMLRETEATND